MRRRSGRQSISNATLVLSCAYVMQTGDVRCFAICVCIHLLGSRNTHKTFCDNLLWCMCALAQIIGALKVYDSCGVRESEVYASKCFDLSRPPESWSPPPCFRFLDPLATSGGGHLSHLGSAICLFTHSHRRGRCSAQHWNRAICYSSLM